MFRTRSQLPLGSAVPKTLLVTKYLLFPDESSDSDLIRIGESIAGRSHDVWTNLSGRRDPPVQANTASSFVFAQKPPPGNAQRHPPILKEWGAEIDSDEIYDTSELEEFISTDLVYLELPIKRTNLGSINDEPPPKRRKLDTASLRNVIPQPHIFPSKASTTSVSSVPPYSKTKPIPIPPHTHPLPAPSPYARRAWVIPARGSLPWRHATTAALLLDSTDLPEPPDPQSYNEIAWTASALASFWDFLLTIRERGKHGSIGISFNVSQYSSSSSQPTYSEVSGMGAQVSSIDLQPAPSTASSVPLSVPLMFTDHIKLYHEAPNSMQLRNILDAWVFESGEGTKIRLLKGARLALLDERSKGVLVS
ncbi:hypothetical protein C8J57DRAFT_1163042 [Mycena rebaudengoi]|nr:hypothetical protein C8J57DRAFT_1163042 [Mycena rebaudengoi]